jgi:hypothetical protein
MLLLRWCECSCHVYLGSLHSAQTQISRSIEIRDSVSTVNRLPLTDAEAGADIITLLSCLSQTNLVAVYAAAVTEQRILLCSRCVQSCFLAFVSTCRCYQTLTLFHRCFTLLQVLSIMLSCFYHSLHKRAVATKHSLFIHFFCLQLLLRPRRLRQRAISAAGALFVGGRIHVGSASALVNFICVVRVLLCRSFVRCTLCTQTQISR